MKFTCYLMLGLLLTLAFSCSSTKVDANDIKYFDENNAEINKSMFKKKRSTNKFLEIPGYSTNHKKLTVREKRGKITNRLELISLLQQGTNEKIDPDKPLVIIYYPGEDPCNSSGTATQEAMNRGFTEMEDGINQIAQTKPIYIYKTNNGLEKYGGAKTWNKDPEKIVEKLFFKHHYPCSSFVVVSKDGDYISYFGEGGKEYVWEATQLMNK